MVKVRNTIKIYEAKNSEGHKILSFYFRWVNQVN